MSLVALLGLAVQGCSSLPPAQDVSAVRLCSAAGCDDTAGRVGAAPLLQSLHDLLARNDGAPLQLCEADPKTGECQQDDVGYFVLGGVLPGRGSARSATLSPVRMDMARQQLHLRMSMPLRFLGGPVRCEAHDATLQVASPGRIAIQGSEHGCNWMLVGIMKASFAFEVETIDLEQGRISGWWRHHVWGTGNGRGKGYASIRFPLGLSPDEARAALQTAAAAP